MPDTEAADDDAYDQPFSFREGINIGESTSSKTGGPASIDVVLRSNQIKSALCALLKKEPGAKFGDEIPSGNRGRVDVVMSLPSGEFDFYEIKPAVAAKHAIREALAQLLEYAYRKGGKEARRLVIVSQAELDSDSSDFLAALRNKGLPISYQRIQLS